jgi:two-component system OmpR family sensor kinase
MTEPTGTMTAATTESSAPTRLEPESETLAGGTEAEPAARLRRLPSVRLRIIAVHLGLLAVATIASVLVAERVILLRLDERIDRELAQETWELRRLAEEGVDPATGKPFGDDVRRLFTVYLQRNVPSHHEALISFVDGKPFLRSRPADVTYRIDRDPELVARWSRLRATDRGSVDTPGGKVEYLAVPIRVSEETLGVFVVAQFRDAERRELQSAVYAVGGVGLAVLLIGSILAWQLASSLLRPVNAVTKTARSISESDLSERIPIRGRDEIAELAQTFNEMLDRLEGAFVTQRRFVDDAGHELRTPITIVRGHLELLGEEPEERRETIALVMDELDRMSRIVNDLLELANVEEPDFLTPTPTDVATLTTEIHAKASALAPRKWTLEASGDGVVVVDRHRITQAVVQLAQNAVQYSDASEPIALGSAVADGEVRFWVRDRGPGIALEEQDRIFGRFARGGGGRRSDGAGLGLAIVNAIAQAHGGRVDVYSRPGAGATFTIVLPARRPG